MAKVQDIYYHWEILQHNDAFKLTNSEAHFKSLAAI